MLLPKDNNFLTKDDATKIALNFLKSKNLNSKTTIIKVNDKINNIKEKCLNINNSDTITNNSELFIVNTKEDGFCVISGHKNVSPILAFSKKGILKIDTSNYGLMNWLHEASLYVKGKKSNLIINKSGDKYISRQKDFKLDERESTLTTTESYKFLYDSISVKPTIKYIWNQSYPFNKFIPHKRKVGCGTLAAAMIMASYEYTNRSPDYNWASINDKNLDNTDTIARYLKDVRSDFGSFKNPNGVIFEGSTATTSHDMIHYLHKYGYTAQKHDYNRNRIFSEVKCNRPVLVLAMGGNPYWSPIDYWAEAHWFTISGHLVEVYSCTTYTYGIADEDIGKLNTELVKWIEFSRSRKIERDDFFYVNWGNGNRTDEDPRNTSSKSNGWFRSFKKGYGGKYHYEKTLITNIKPNN
jgi:hypothetical protein